MLYQVGPFWLLGGCLASLCPPPWSPQPVVPSMVGVVPSMAGVVPSMVGVVPSMAGVLRTFVANTNPKPSERAHSWSKDHQEPSTAASGLATRLQEGIAVGIWPVP